MKRWKRDYRIKWAGLAILFLMAGMFSAGIGVCRFMGNQIIRSSYENSSVIWKQELAHGLDQQEARDLRNRQLVNSMNYVSMEQQIYFEYTDTAGEARISNKLESDLGCVVALIRDATGEEVYRSDVIEPGHYIENIRLNGRLKKGFYPCTAVWSFYTGDDEYVGETARKAVIVIKN